MSHNPEKRQYFITYLVNTKDGKTHFMNGVIEIPRLSIRALHDTVMNLGNKHDAIGITILFMVRLEKDDVYDSRGIPAPSDGASEKSTIIATPEIRGENPGN